MIVVNCQSSLAGKLLAKHTTAVLIAQAICVILLGGPTSSMCTCAVIYLVAAGEAEVLSVISTVRVTGWRAIRWSLSWGVTYYYSPGDSCPSSARDSLAHSGLGNIEGNGKK